MRTTSFREGLGLFALLVYLSIQLLSMVRWRDARTLLLVMVLIGAVLAAVALDIYDIRF